MEQQRAIESKNRAEAELVLMREKLRMTDEKLRMEKEKIGQLTAQVVNSYSLISYSKVVYSNCSIAFKISNMNQSLI